MVRGPSLVREQTIDGGQVLFDLSAEPPISSAPGLDLRLAHRLTSRYGSRDMTKGPVLRQALR
jgi:hypothetical protein